MNKKIVVLVGLLILTPNAFACPAIELLSQLSWSSAVESRISQFGTANPRTVALIVEPLGLNAGQNAGEAKILRQVKSSCLESHDSELYAILATNLSDRSIPIAAMNSDDLRKVVEEVNRLGIGNFDLTTFNRNQFSAINYIVRVKAILQPKRNGMNLGTELKVSTEVLETSTRRLLFTPILTANDQQEASLDSLNITSVFMALRNSDGRMHAKVELENQNDGTICVPANKAYVISGARLGTEFNEIRALNARWAPFLRQDVCVAPHSRAWLDGYADPPFGNSPARCIKLDLDDDERVGQFEFSFTEDEVSGTGSMARCGRSGFEN